jgi:hypothetical protein
MGAAGAEAAAEAECPVEPDTSRGQTAGESLEMVLKLATFVDHTDARRFRPAVAGGRVIRHRHPGIPDEPNGKALFRPFAPDPTTPGSPSVLTPLK